MDWPMIESLSSWGEEWLFWHTKLILFSGNLEITLKAIVLENIYPFCRQDIIFASLQSVLRNR